MTSAGLTRLAKCSVSTWHNVPSVFIRRQNVGASLRVLIASFVTKKTLTVDTAQKDKQDERQKCRS